MSKSRIFSTLTAKPACFLDYRCQMVVSLFAASLKPRPQVHNAIRHLPKGKLHVHQESVVRRTGKGRNRSDVCDEFSEVVSTTCVFD